MAARDLEAVAERVAALRRLVAQRPDAWLDLDLTMPQLRALFAVRGSGPLAVSALAEAMGMRLAAASALANRLVRDGLLDRAEDPADRRRTLLTLTATAEELLAGVDGRAGQRVAGLLRRMSPGGRQALATALDELLRLAEEDAS
jgi:DNA-binding MarR family transcriptional regulator